MSKAVLLELDAYIIALMDEYSQRVSRLSELGDNTKPDPSQATEFAEAMACYQLLGRISLQVAKMISIEVCSKEGHKYKKKEDSEFCETCGLTKEHLEKS